MVINSINHCDRDVRKTLFNQIIVAGGTSMLTGFNERLHKSLQRLVSREVSIQLKAPKNRKNSCWIGGATVSSLKTFNKMWVTKKLYEEEGQRIFYDWGF
jgi:actin-related protein